MRTRTRLDIQGIRSLGGACTFRGSSVPFSMNANVKLTTSTKRRRLSFGTTFRVSSMGASTKRTLEFCSTIILCSQNGIERFGESPNVKVYVIFSAFSFLFLLVDPSHAMAKESIFISNIGTLVDRSSSILNLVKTSFVRLGKV